MVEMCNWNMHITKFPAEVTWPASICSCRNWFKTTRGRLHREFRSKPIFLFDFLFCLFFLNLFPCVQSRVQNSNLADRQTTKLTATTTTTTKRKTTTKKQKLSNRGTTERGTNKYQDLSEHGGGREAKKGGGVNILMGDGLSSTTTAAVRICYRAETHRRGRLCRWYGGSVSQRGGMRRGRQDFEGGG